MSEVNYGQAIQQAFDHLLGKYPDVFILGQGLWSPWYVGNTMTGLEKKYGSDRVFDTPVSEAACTGAAVGASLAGMRPIVVHPRIDFMLYAMDAVVNQAAKWSLMTGGQANPRVTIRGIVNRGGEQGAQHSQALHSWFSHIPGLRVVMPATVADARDLLIASVLCNDPVVYIDDRWLYDEVDTLGPICEPVLAQEGPRVIDSGADITLVASGYSTRLARDARRMLAADGVSAEVVDLRVLNPLDPSVIVNSVRRTKRLLVIDGSWASCGMSAEVIASVVEILPPDLLSHSPVRITLPPSPAPTANCLEKLYYPDAERVFVTAKHIVHNVRLES